MILPEQQIKMAQWRQKAQEGSLSQQDMIEIITTLRHNRMAAATASASGTRKKATKVIPVAGDLLAELEGL